MLTTDKPLTYACPAHIKELSPEEVPMEDERPLYHYVAPSGVHVVSTVPFTEPRWWDRKSLHLFWSYASWGSMFLDELGWKYPRKMFKRYWTR